MTFDRRLDSARLALKIGLGLAAFLAGLDKFFDLLADWPRYLAPAVQATLPLDATTFMRVVGIVEMLVGLAILTSWTRIGSRVAMVWLLAIAGNLLLSGAFLDVAVRDVEMAIAAFALARLTDARDSAAATEPVTSAVSASRVSSAA